MMFIYRRLQKKFLLKDRCRHKLFWIIDVLLLSMEKSGCSTTIFSTLKKTLRLE